MTPDKFFDLNKAVAEAKSEALGRNDDDEWLHFDLGPNYLEPPSGPDDQRSEEERRRPWRARFVASGWELIDFVSGETFSARMRAARTIIRQAIDPEQWTQFEAVMRNADQRIPLDVIEVLANQIARVNIGLPLDR